MRKTVSVNVLGMQNPGGLLGACCGVGILPYSVTPRNINPDHTSTHVNQSYIFQFSMLSMISE